MNAKETHHALSRARAMHELQLQQPVLLKEGARALGVVFPAEFLEEKQWATLIPLKPQLLLSAARAKLLGFIGVTSLKASAFSLPELQQWVAGNSKTLTTTEQLQAPDFGAAVISLAKQSGIIPALIFIPDAQLFSDAYALDIAALNFVPKVELIRGETVALPIEGAEHATLTSFRTRYDAGVHLVLTIGNINAKTPPLVRVHSSCVTGDLLGSLRCDCGGQLQSALARIKDANAGVLLYLNQEGRGIGISSKLKAYALQERGLDTFAANQQLGFEEDERDFSLAANILQELGLKKIRLLTNNPDKIEAFVESSITVAERLPLVMDHNAHNHAYLAAKRIKHGHC